MKRFALLLFAAVISTIVMAQRKETTILEVAGNLATPLTVHTSKGTYTVHSSAELNGSVSVRSAEDANGNKVVVPNGDYKSHTSNGKSEYTRIYRFRTLYNNSSSSSSSSSSYGNNIYKRRNSGYEEQSNSNNDITGYWIYTNPSNRNFTEAKNITKIAEGKYEIESLTFFNGELQGKHGTEYISINENGELEGKSEFRRSYDHAIRTTISIYKIKGNQLMIHSRYKTDYYSDSDFQYYSSTGEISESDFVYTRR